MSNVTEGDNTEQQLKHIRTPEIVLFNKRHATVNMTAPNFSHPPLSIRDYELVLGMSRGSWWEFQCNELEALERMGRSDLVYAKVNELSKEKRGGKKQDSVLSKDGILLTEANDISSRWKEYIEDLYASGERPDELPLELEEEVDEDDRGPDILKEEILQAII
ncbi:hypothetical protein JOB18_037166 [Solea senegalensis]|uniref:Uncharacterized protein n=1 Tax=Solea senegalensis TaxID=28829 RepID=A0AAV6Q741_SOLSE|nr:hypothetical protein JOB18_037166 [Solea senegalensis]